MPRFLTRQKFNPSRRRLLHLNLDSACLLRRQGLFEPDANATNASSPAARRKPGWTMALSVDMDAAPAARPADEQLTPEEAEQVRLAKVCPSHLPPRPYSTQWPPANPSLRERCAARYRRPNNNTRTAKTILAPIPTNTNTNAMASTLN